MVIAYLPSVLVTMLGDFVLTEANAGTSKDYTPIELVCESVVVLTGTYAGTRPSSARMGSYALALILGTARRSSSAMSGTDLAYGGTCYPMPGTDLAHGGTCYAMPGTELARMLLPEPRSLQLSV
eukprot:3898579-Rhodomonas_salina.5